MPAKPCTTRNKIFEALSNGPLTTNEISIRTGVSYNCVSATISKLRQARGMYIAEWRISPTVEMKRPSPAYMFGNKPDTSRPPPAPRVRQLSPKQKLEKLHREFGPSPSVFGHMLVSLT